MAKKNYDRILTRLVSTLTKLSNDERPTTKELAEEFNVTVRTIQKDLSNMLYNYPITRDSEGRLMFEYGYSLKRTSLNNDELIFLDLALSQFDEVADIDKIKTNIYKKIINQNICSPYFIKQDDIEDIDIDSPFISQLEECVKSQEVVQLKFEHKTSIVEPYKIVNYDGFWYLFGKDEADGKVKTFRLSKIKKIIPLQKYHKTSHETIDGILDKTHSAFFDDGSCFDIKIKVHSDIAHYFQTKEFLQSQEILQEHPDGSLEVSFEVSHDEDVDNIIKAWLPHVEVIEPARYKEKFLNELKSYIKQIETN